MAQWVLNLSGYVVTRQTLRPLHVDELQIPEDQNKRNIFGALIERRWGKLINPSPVQPLAMTKSGRNTRMRMNQLELSSK